MVKVINFFPASQFFLFSLSSSPPPKQTKTKSRNVWKGRRKGQGQCIERRQHTLFRASEG